MSDPSIIKKCVLVILSLLLMRTAQSQNPSWQHLLPLDDNNKNPNLAISTYSGVTHINFNAELIRDLEIKIQSNGLTKQDVELPKAMWGEVLSFEILPLTSLDFLAPYGSFKDFTSGWMVHNGGFEIELPNLKVDANGFTIRVQSQKQRVLEIIDNMGNVLFELKTPRVIIDSKQASMKIVEMNMQMSSYLAEKHGNIRLAGLPVGTVAIDTSLLIPENAAITPQKGGVCAGRPLWPTNSQELVDVGFTDLTVVYKRRRVDGNGGNEAMFAPSSSLINLADGAVGADVPWFGFYSGSNDPYGNSQHPYLVWSLYRKMNGRIEQIGRSGMKHAFLTINVGCNNCGSSHILWPQCQDTYSSGNNDSNYYLGPRIELESNSGEFEETPSFFDPAGAGNHSNSSTDWQNRLVVNEAELDIPGAEYIFDSWYLVRDDVNIFNTMGYRYVDLNFTGSSWSVSHLSPNTILGSLMDTWVNGGLDEQTVNITENKGHLRMDTKVSDLGSGNYHYEYALTNFDYDPRIKTFSVSLPPGVTAQNTGFSGPQGYLNLSNYKYETALWDINQVGSKLVFTATGVGHMLDWGGLYNFYFDAQVAPVAGQVKLESGEIASDIFVDILVPEVGSDIIFENGFE